VKYEPLRAEIDIHMIEERLDSKNIVVFWSEQLGSTPLWLSGHSVYVSKNTRLYKGNPGFPSAAFTGSTAADAMKLNQTH
jgi:hypothetical protein